MSVIDGIIEFAKAIASEVSGPNSAVLYNLTGAPGFRVDAEGNPVDSDDNDEAGEQAISQTGYQSLGIVGRPLPPDGELHAETVSARTGDGMEPFAWRDLRINRALNPTGAGTAPAEGQVLFAGYGGGFVSHRPTDGNTGSKPGTVTTIYVPADFDADGVPQKAHAIVLDPTPGNSSVQLIHADGVFLSLTEDVGIGEPGISWSTSDESFGRVSESEVLIQAPKIMLKGNVYVGAQPETGVPLLAGAASPPCPSLFVSPV